MKHAFTMMELIFIIIILGILATVAIPRLTAARSDAELSKAVASLNLLVNDLRSYYMAQADFSDNLKNMTNIVLANDSIGHSSSILVGGKKCLKVILNKNQIDGKPAFLKVEPENTTNSICQKVLNAKVIQDILNNKFSYTKKSTKTTETSGLGEFEISGIDANM